MVLLFVGVHTRVCFRHPPHHTHAHERTAAHEYVCTLHISVGGWWERETERRRGAHKPFEAVGGIGAGEGRERERVRERMCVCM